MKEGDRKGAKSLLKWGWHAHPHMFANVRRINTVLVEPSVPKGNREMRLRFSGGRPSLPRGQSPCGVGLGGEAFDKVIVSHAFPCQQNIMESSGVPSNAYIPTLGAEAHGFL